MFILKYLLYFISIYLFSTDPQINLYYTDENTQSNSVIQHDCIRLVYSSGTDIINHHIVYFCLNQLPAMWKIEQDDSARSSTFDELRKQNVTSDNLYHWSTSIDLIEEYQSNVNKNSFSSNNTFYKCKWPRFGSRCQYQMNIPTGFSSLNVVIESYYKKLPYEQSMVSTCYEHLKCTRQSLPICLQWREICDGEVQCVDTNEDEQNCWQLEMNECEKDEYRCRNGQCIPYLFFDDGRPAFDCIDQSDEFNLFIRGISQDLCTKYKMPSFGCDDIQCKYILFSNSCQDYDYSERFNTHQLMVDDPTVSNDCFTLISCLISLSQRPFDLQCEHICLNDTCFKTFNETCPDILLLKMTKNLLNNLHYIFQKNQVNYRYPDNLGQLYICYKDSIYDRFFPMNLALVYGNSRCLFSETLFYYEDQDSSMSTLNLLNKLQRTYTINNDLILQFCNQTNMYQCENSTKCISIHRLVNNIYDCPFMDDELIRDKKRLEQIEKTHYKCPTTGKYIRRNQINDEFCDCGGTFFEYCEDEDHFIHRIQRNLSFQMICDGFEDLSPVIIDGRYESDETDCQVWECHNIYTHCDKVQHCSHGIDEVGCIVDTFMSCSSNQTVCVSQKTNELICLPFEQTNDDHIDCIGGTDESFMCPRVVRNTFFYYFDFYCQNSTSNICIHPSNLCDGQNQCLNDDDERFCTQKPKRFIDMNTTTCQLSSDESHSNIEQFFCDYFEKKTKLERSRFELNSMVQSENHQIRSTSSSEFRCHRGIPLLVWLDFKNNLSSNACLCPLMYYGSLCQYQNQRVSLTAKFRALSDSWRTSFVIVFTLVDNSVQRIIHSFEKIDFFWQINCRSKFHFYLLYSTQPKDITKNYSIQIDFYEKNSLKYRGSALYPIRFSFLPVYRLSILVNIPRTNDKNQYCSDKKCFHGTCIRYQNETFCYCDEGWSGQECSIEYRCTCSTLTSRCVGVLPNNRSICICKTNYFGSRCLLNNRVCEKNNNSTCLNGGQCIPNDDQLLSKRTFLCICPDGYSGVRCEIFNTRLIISFTKDILLSELVYIHFIDTTIFPKLVRTTIFRLLSHEQNSLIIGWSKDFNIVFTKLLHKRYYLTVRREKPYSNITINKTISLSDYCPNITESFNQTFRQWPLIRRIKFYHLPCQNHSLNLSCFHDELHLCLCYEFHGKHLANCFEFNHEIKFDCDGRNECERDSQCFQDEKDCPTKSICLCQPCSFGKRCQFRMSGFGLSLDAILGYHIQPDVSLSQQSAIVKFSLTLTIVFVLIGFIDGFLSLITFKNKPVRSVGCGIYLLYSSITTIVTSVMLLLKFSILLSAQMNIISNRIFLNIQCHLFDFLLRCCLYFDQWLTACVAVERAFTVMQETRFNQKKSQRTAKYVILLLLIILLVSSIQDPIYYHLLDETNDDNDEIKRIWCVIIYPTEFLQRFNSYIHAFHFLIPFQINFISTIMLITIKAHQQLRIQKNRSYQRILREQYQQHKQILIAPIVLVLLGLPRLILTFISKCMKSSNDAWLYIILYFISFIPTMLTFIVFILPSKFYKKEFSKSIDQYRLSIQRRLHLTKISRRRV